MPLRDGTRLGPYEIVSPIGAGGMGEVYKARDTRLDRTVAIKVIPEAAAALPEVRQRFEREARAVSSLNHPHICSLFDVGQEGGIDFLVMEYLQGETLSERLKKGPVPMPQALAFAIDIASALDAAHRAGVIHRDLKPANIVLTPSGPKVLDFGLAKIQPSSGPAVAGESVLETLTTPLTAQHAIVGTLQYMAPEQLEGKEADARTDIFSFGAVVYEMLTGKRAFQAGTHAALISSIMMTEPPAVSAVQPMASAPLDHLIRTCLAKDPAERWNTAHDLLVQLKWIASAGPQAATAAGAVGGRRKREWALAGAAAVFAVAVAALGIVHFRESPAPVRPVRFQLQLPPKVGLFENTIAVSPDGSKIVFGAARGAAKPLLWLHSLDAVEPRPLPGTEGALFPFWSPDSRSIAFTADQHLKRLDISGSVTQDLCPCVSLVGGAWNRDGVILVGAGPGVVQRVPAGGGEPKPVLKLDASRGEAGQVFPWFLPDGRHFLYWSAAKPPNSGIRIGSLDGTNQPLLPDRSNASFAQPGFILFARQANLMAVPFNPDKLALTGDAFPVVDNLARHPNNLTAYYGVSETGVLAWRGASTLDSRLARYSREGRRLGAIGDARPIRQFYLSPDDRFASLEVSDAKPGIDLWAEDLASGITTRLTYDGLGNGDPVWSPDGRNIVFVAARNGVLALYRKVLGSPGDAEVVRLKERQYPAQQLVDGSILILNLNGKAFSRVRSGNPEPEVLLANEFAKDGPQVSNDGRWIAYHSDETGRWEVYVAAFPSFTERRQVSTGGGLQPHWRKDGKELFYLTQEGQIMAIPVKGVASLETGLPVELFRTSVRVAPTPNQYSPTSDGKMFYVLERAEETPAPINVLLNWTAARR